MDKPMIQMYLKKHEDTGSWSAYCPLCDWHIMLERDDDGMFHKKTLNFGDLNWEEGKGHGHYFNINETGSAFRMSMKVKVKQVE